MKIHQVSTFIENRPGQLLAPCKALADAGINILTLSLSDTREFGIVHFIVDDWLQAKRVLENSGLVVNVSEVVVLEIEDRPGGLAAVLDILEAGKVNIEYMYAFTFGCDRKAALVFRFEAPDMAVEVLQQANVNLVSTPDLKSRCV